MQRQGEVLLDAEGADDALGRPVGRHEREARCVVIAQVDPGLRLRGQPKRAAHGALPRSGDGVGQRLAAGSGQAGDAEQLALAQLEADAAQDSRAQVADLEQRATRAVRRLGADRDVDVLADHHRREGLRREVGDVAGADEPAAAQDGDAIGEVEDLVHPVRDVEDARAAAPDLAHDLQELVDLGVRQHGRGLVEHEHAAAALPALQRGGDGDDGALDGRRVHQRVVDVDVHAEPADERASGLLLR